MARALEKYFQTTIDLDVEAQRGIVVLKKPMTIEWRQVETKINSASFTFGGAHFRTRGQAIQDGSNPGRFLFEIAGSGQRLAIKNAELAKGLTGSTLEVAARLEDWKSAVPSITIIEKH